MKRRDTEELILAEALRLFNEKSASQVSTNHICEACNISPGNLYYYFANKDEIINELFARMIQRWDDEGPPLDASLETFSAQFERIFTFLWDYRFIHRDLTYLLRENEGFRKIFHRAQKKRLAQIDQALEMFSRSGVLKKLDSEEIKRLRRILWFFSLHWLSFLEMEGTKIVPSSVRESVLILRTLFQPYLA